MKIWLKRHTLLVISIPGSEIYKKSMYEKNGIGSNELILLRQPCHKHVRRT